MSLNSTEFCVSSICETLITVKLWLERRVSLKWWLHLSLCFRSFFTKNDLVSWCNSWHVSVTHLGKFLAKFCPHDACSFVRVYTESKNIHFRQTHQRFCCSSSRYVATGKVPNEVLDGRENIYFVQYPTCLSYNKTPLWNAQVLWPTTVLSSPFLLWSLSWAINWHRPGGQNGTTRSHTHSVHVCVSYAAFLVKIVIT